ncbi:MAG: hypothetical protein Q8941_06045 [Bacteroidota bacterium]|nr:hypothetical protein [Bacteroidota bacterium]
MKLFLSIAGVLILLSFSRSPRSFYLVPGSHVDTGHIIHVLDGLVAEWPDDKFQINNDSTIEFAADNDDKNLYVAMSVPDFDMQMKIMRNGMKLYIDTKGKKKEGKGIEFPVKGEAGNFSGGFSNPGSNNGAGDDPQKKKFDKKSARNIMSLGLTALKLFGFGGDKEDEQGLTMPGSVNIAFKWDAGDIMCIEYNIPLSLLGESSSLNQKDISLGWKINAFERPGRPQGMEQPGENEGGPGGGGFSRGMGGGRGQYGGGGGRGFRGGARGAGSRTFDPEEMKKEQSFWTKYMISLQPAQKAF